MLNANGSPMRERGNTRFGVGPLAYASDYHSVSSYVNSLESEDEAEEMCSSLTRRVSNKLTNRIVRQSEEGMRQLMASRMLAHSTILVTTLAGHHDQEDGRRLIV